MMGSRDALLEKINRKQELEAELKEQLEILRTVSGNYGKMQINAD